MTATFTINKKGWVSAIFLAALFMILLTTQVHAGVSDSSITLKKEPGSSIFILTVRDPDGVQEFSLTPSGKNPYGGILSGCPGSYINERVVFDDPSDFTPVMSAYVIDCRNNTLKLEIAPPQAGLAKSAPVVKKEESPPAPKPLPPEESKKVEKKAGPLSASDIQYPVKELGGCKSEAECRSYCDNSQRAKECFAFAKKYNLITDKDAERAEKEFFNVRKGPGGCNSGVSCESYCNNVEHLDECIAFAEDSGYYSGDKLAEAKKFQALVKSGKQFPGGCKDRNACEIYCNTPQHMEECLNFAEETGFMPKEEIEQARRILPLMQRGETPGGCTSKEQCEKYCFEESHSDECIAFGEKAGLISKEDAEMIKKTHGKGPGGCRSKEQCEAYCQNNSDACFQWAQDNGFFSEKDLAKMKKGMAQFKEQLDKIPPEVTQCLKDSVGEKNFEKLVNGQPVFDRGMEQKMKACFSEITSQVSKQLNTLPPEAAQCIKDTIGEAGLQKLQSGEFGEDVDFSDLEGCFQKLQASFGGGPGGPGGPGGGGFSGPGGCKSIEECTSFCQTNPKECQNFAPPGGGGFPGGPGGGFPGGPGGGGEDTSGFAACGITKGAPASFVCGINGKGAPSGVEVTYFNECHAKAHGAEVLHEGVCKGHKPCNDIANPVCGTDGISYTHECIAKEKGATVKHEGGCTAADFGGGFGGSGGFPGGGIPSGKDYVGPGGCRTPDECIRYCKEPGHDKECGEFKTPATTPYAKGRGPGGCGSVEECREYCTHEHQAECDAFVSESVPPEGKCQAGYQIERDALGYKYCNPLSCPEGQAFHTDVFGRRACSPVGIPGGPAGGGFPQTPPQPQTPGYKVPEFQAPQYPQTPGGGSSYEIPATPELCANFGSIPACSYVGSTDSQNYKLCKQCFPTK